MEQQPRSTLLTLPGAIIIAAAIVAVAVIWVQRPATNNTSADANNTKNQDIKINLNPVTAKDHIFGNPNAQIKIVEYSDPSCSYCKMFNPTLISILDQYGPSGKVAWVYRSFPLDKPDLNGNALHPNAGHESQALECVASLGGNDKFWAFEKKIYEENSTGAQGLDQKKLPIFAKEIGINVDAFNKCLSDGQFKETVEASFLSGVNAGVAGTPSSFIVLNTPISTKNQKFMDEAMIQYGIPREIFYTSSDKKIISMSGALPKEFVSGLINELLGN